MSPHDQPLDTACAPEGEPGLGAGGGVAILADAPFAPRENFTHMLIDLDDTLYQVEEVSGRVLGAIKGYMHKRLGIPEDEVSEVAKKYYASYGTTLAGLVAKDGGDFTIDFDDWHKECHHFLDYRALLKPDPELKALLDSIPLKKWVFTNADKTHAEEALAALGLAECFDGTIHFESIMEAASREGLLSNGGVLCKPNPESYRVALESAGMKASSTLFLDDSVRNVSSARAYGIHSILVKPGNGHWDGPTIGSLSELPQAVPELWSRERTSDSMHAVAEAPSVLLA